MADPEVTVISMPDAAQALRAAGVNLRGLFDCSPFAVQVYAPDGHSLYVNPAYRTLWGLPETYSPPADDVVSDGAGPERMELMPFIRRGSTGESVSLPVTRYSIDDAPTLPGGQPRWIRTSIYPIYDDANAIRAVVVTHIDATEQEEAQHLLEARVEERTHELSTLLGVSRTLSSTIELELLLGLILDQLKVIVDYTSATAITHEGGRYLMRGYRGPLPREAVRSRSLPSAAVDGLVGLFPQDTTFIIPDVWADTPAAEAWRATGSEEYLRTAPAYMGCLLNAPLTYKGRLIGLLTLGHRTPGYFTEHHAALTQAVAEQVAGLIEHARLFEQEQRTSQELASLLEVSHSLASTLELELLLHLILEQLQRVIDYRGATIGIIEGDELLVAGSRAVSPEREADRGLRFKFDRSGPIIATIGADRPVMIDDVRGDSPEARDYRAINTGLMEGPTHREIRAWMAVPLAVKDRVIGQLTMSQDTPAYFTAHHAELAQAFAAQAAVAIENARLYEQARRLAVLEERQRLSRELHDSVSQALFGIGLGARTARTLLERKNPDKALGSVDYVISLAEAGMAEMRALLFELRPDSLASEGLVAALTKQAAVLTLRHELTVDTVFCEEPDVALETKEALYRIAQEALHNIVKHAKATAVILHLTCDADGITLSVRDDGVGFDSTDSFPGHIGQHSMRERAERLGGALTVESAPGAGVCLRVLIPAERA